MNDTGPVILALGGGGARGLAHVGVLQALETAGVRVAAVAGTSMGGMLGALYAAGVAVEEIEAAILRLAKPGEMLRLVDLGLGASGISVKGVRICELLTEMIGAELGFEELRMPCAVVAVDVISGREVVLDRGPVAQAVRATISIPGVFEPVTSGSMRLVDGGILNNLPVDVARTLGGDPVVAVDVMPQFRRNRPGQEPVVPGLELSSIPKVLKDTAHVHMVMVSEMTAMRLDLSPADRMIAPDLPVDVSILTGFRRAGEIIEAGRHAAERALRESTTG
jgi:NTE family protein